MPKCEDCKVFVTEGKGEPVPFTVHELDMARLERSNKRSFILNVILVVALFLSWIGFMVYESQFETIPQVTQDVWQESEDGGSNYNRFVGGDDYGEATHSDEN